MQKITPFLWYNDQAEEAMNYYLSIFKDGKRGTVSRMGSGPDAKVFSCTFTLNGQEFHALNGGPHYQFNPAVSFFISCETQEEVDHYWEKLSEGGRQDRCGWLVDQFGLSWQVVPTLLSKLMQDPDKDKANRVMQAMMQMTKLDMAALQRAYNGEPAAV